MNAKYNAGNSTWNDPDDAPELTDAFFERATVGDGARVVRRGRPKAEQAKASVTLRLDTDVLAGLRATGPGWQTRANEALKQWLVEDGHRPG